MSNGSDWKLLVVGETMQTYEKFEKYVNIWYSRDSMVISLHNSLM